MYSANCAGDWMYSPCASVRGSFGMMYGWMLSSFSMKPDRSTTRSFSIGKLASASIVMRFG